MKRLCLLVFLFYVFGSLQAQRLSVPPVATKVLLDTSYALGKNITERDILYLDRSGKKVSVHVAKAHLKKRHLVLEAATPFNKDRFARQTVMEEMKWEAQPSHQPIVGVNADFFNMKNGTPLGVVVKEGRTLKNHFNKTNCFVGVLRNGRVILGDSVLFKKNEDKLAEALGARPLLIKAGKVQAQDSSGLSKIHHPRTALGLINYRNILLVTVDGRQPQVSNGISLTDLALLMEWLGARDAVNLDGGGSTTMVVNAEGAGDFTVRNQPSGKATRAVANSWILVRKH